MAEFERTNAVVTGAAGGVGSALVTMLRHEGSTVALLGRTPATLDAVAAVREPGEAICYPVDLSRDDQVADVIEKLTKDLPGVDILVHCAGAYVQGPVETTPVAALDEQYRVNVRSAYVITRGLLGPLRKRRGQVLFVNSTTGLMARGGIGAYAATKHALKAIADSLRDEVNKEGIRVTSLFLGRTASPMQERIHAMEGRPYSAERLVQPEDVAAVVKATLALPRTAEVTDIRLRPMLAPV